VSEMLAKKAEGRPLTPEEYDQIAQFVDQIERRFSIQARAVEKKPVLAEEKLDKLSLNIPADLFTQNLLNSTLPEHISNSLQEVGIITSGDLIAKMKTNPDDVFRIQGIGPRAMEAISKFVSSTMPEVVVSQPDQIVEEPQEESLETKFEVSIEKLVETISVPSLESQITEEAVTSVPEEEVGLVLETAEASEVRAEEAQIEEVELQPIVEAELAEEAVTLDKWFALAPDAIQPPADETEDEESDSSDKSSKKKKKKKKSYEMEYDPEQGKMIVRKKHKRGKEDWDY
jgi:transcription termination/antitermination protein NusA